MSWMNDVQKGLAWALTLCFVIIVVLFTGFTVFGHLADSILDVYKQVVTALINIVMIVIGFFFGSSQGSKDGAAARNDALRSLAANVPGPGGSAAAAAADAAPAAAAAAAPAAAAAAAPPAAEVAAPPAAEVAVAAALAEREGHSPFPA